MILHMENILRRFEMTAQERYGNEVWRGLQEASVMVEPGICSFVSVGEVAQYSRVSKPTAQKYLEVLAKEGHIASLKIGKQTFYRMLIKGDD